MTTDYSEIVDIDGRVIKLPCREAPPPECERFGHLPVYTPHRVPQHDLDVPTFVCQICDRPLSRLEAEMAKAKREACKNPAMPDPFSLTDNKETPDVGF